MGFKKLTIGSSQRCQWYNLEKTFKIILYTFEKAKARKHYHDNLDMLGSYFRLVKKASQYYTYVLLNRLMMRVFCMTFSTACKVREFLQQILLVSRLCVKHLTQYLNHLHLCRGLSPQVVNSSTERKILI